MARLAAKEKMLYYPTPNRIMELIATNIQRPKNSCIILDPCCGTGEAVEILGRELNCQTFGNELHPGRAGQAEQRLDGVVCGAREFLQVTGQPHIIFNNPPYDDSIVGSRMELLNVKADTDIIRGNGLAIWVLPESVLGWDLLSFIAEHYTEINMRRFPKPEYDAFNQVVIFARKGHVNAHTYYTRTVQLERAIEKGLPVLQANEFEYWFDKESPYKIELDTKFPDISLAVELAEEKGVQHTEQWKRFFRRSSSTLIDFQPVLPLSDGHMALAIAAGMVDGMETDIGDEPHIIKGSTSKEISVTFEEGEESDKVRKRENFTQTIASLNLNTGDYSWFNNKQDPDGFKFFLTTHQEQLVETVDKNYPALFDPAAEMPAWTEKLQKIHAPGKLPGQKRENGLLPAQQVRVAALVKKFGSSAGNILVGEMGSGKTAMSQAIMALVGKGNWKLVVVCPPQVVEKWGREAKKVLRQFDIEVHVIGERRRQPDGKGKVRKCSKPVLDTIEAMESDKPALLVMSYQTAKNDSRWEHAISFRPGKMSYTALEKRELYYYPYTEHVEVVKTKAGRLGCCPDCGAFLKNDKGMPITNIKELGRTQRSCRVCCAPLWQKVPFKYGGRVAIADFLNRHYSGRFNVIMDEAHHTKGADTDAGYASQALVSGAKKVLAMTGTLYAGKASSIFSIMYRLFWWFREIYDYNEVQKFVEHHGLQEEIISKKKDRSEGYNSAYGYVRENVRYREVPGVSPAMVMMLLNNTAFIKMSDMNLDMPDYVEERYPVPLDERLEKQLDKLMALRKEAVEWIFEGSMSMLSQWMRAALAWVDCPVDEEFEAKKDGKVLATRTVDGFLDEADEMLDEPLAKDQALLEIIEAELSQGRGVGVFFAQVNRRDWMGRIQKLLKAKGIYSEILRRETAKPDEREAWFQDFVQRCRLIHGQEPVLLANGNLVKEGLDLIELPTLVETGIEYRINDLRQRDRRSWRLIQDKPVRVVFLYYENTFQEVALELVSEKLKAAKIVDGDLAEGLAAMNADDGNLMDKLMKMVRDSNRLSLRQQWNGSMKIAQFEKRTEPDEPDKEPDEKGKSNKPPIPTRKITVATGVEQISFF